MVSTYNVQQYIYQFNATINAYSPVLVSSSYPYLMALNMAFLGLTLLLGLFDIFEKYGVKFKFGKEN